MIICLVRHGQTNWNKIHLVQGITDNRLNELGRNQAINAANYLKKHDPNWDIIISSPLLRAKETAEIIAKHLNYQEPIILNSAFQERSFGVLEGKTLNTETYSIIFSESAEGLESFNDLQNRMAKGLIALEKKYKNKKVLIASHSQAIKSLLCYADANFDFKFPLKNSSLNYLEINNGEIKIIKYNIT